MEEALSYFVDVTPNSRRLMEKRASFWINWAKIEAIAGNFDRGVEVYAEAAASTAADGSASLEGDQAKVLEEAKAAYLAHAADKRATVNDSVGSIVQASSANESVGSIAPASEESVESNGADLAKRLHFSFSNDTSDDSLNLSNVSRGSGGGGGNSPMAGAATAQIFGSSSSPIGSSPIGGPSGGHDAAPVMSLVSAAYDDSSFGGDDWSPGAPPLRARRGAVCLHLTSSAVCQLSAFFFFSARTHIQRGSPCV